MISLSGCETAEEHLDCDVGTHYVYRPLAYGGEYCDVDQYNSEDQITEFVENLQKQIDQLETDMTLQDEQYSELEQVLNQLVQDTPHTYGIDEYGNYITFEQLGNKLLEKYFGDYTLISDGLFYRNDTIEFRIKLSDSYLLENDINDLTARLILVLNEFSEYTLYNQAQNNMLVSIQVRDEEMIIQESIQIIFDTSLFNYVEITPQHLINELYEVQFSSSFSQPSITLIEQYLQSDYGDFVLNIE